MLFQTKIYLESDANIPGITGYVIEDASVTDGDANFIIY